MKSSSEKILSLMDDSDALEKCLSSYSNDTLKDIITGGALTGKSVCPVIKGIFQGSPTSSSEGSKRRLFVYEVCIPLCESRELQSEVAADIIGLLMLQTQTLPGPALAHLASLFVEAIKVGKMGSGKSLELFPTVLTALTSCPALSYGEGELSGEEYKKQLINSLCSSRWDPPCVLHLTTMFRDVPLSSDELHFLVEKILRMFSKLDLQEIPPLVYQLLLLSAKGCKKLILDGIIAYFKEQDLLQEEEQNRGESLDLEIQSIPQDQLRHVEGTVILHMVFAVRLHHELAREFLKGFKTSYGDLCSFSVALLLSVARVQRYEEQVFDLLKGSIMKNLKEHDLQQGSKFLQEVLPRRCSIDHMILGTVNNSVFGWDHVTQGLVQLGFFLMDTFGPKPGPFGKTPEAVPAAAAKTPAQLSCRLGRQVLLQGFKVHEPIRGEILEQVLNRLVTKTASPVTHYLELFSDIVVSAPMILLESSSKVTETFDHLSFLPLATVQGLLKAVQPLLKVSVSLKDSLILVLRKAMFSSQLDGRKSAVTGFLLLLKNFRVLGSLASSQCSQSVSSSQIHVDVHSRYNSAANEAFCLEILSSLRRCLGQQADIRLMLYEGFYDVLRRNSQLASSIMQTLFSQLRRYYESEPDLLPPVKLQTCITAHGDQIYLQEPLAHLLSCTVHCLLWLQTTGRAVGPDHDEDDHEDDEQEGYESELQDILENMSRRMIKSQLEDFELDKSAEFSVGSSVGVKNNIYAVLVMGVYEVLMEYNFVKANYSKSRFEELLLLFHRYHKLSEILKEKCGKGRTTSHKTPRSFLSLGLVSTLLTVIFRDSSQSREEALSVLRSSAEFVRYVLCVAVQKIQQLEETGHVDGPDGQNSDKTFVFLCDMTSVLMWRYTNISSSVEDGEKKEKRCSLSLLCLEGLLRIFSTCQQRLPHKMKQLLSNMDVGDDEPDDGNNTEMNVFYIRQFQRALFTQLSGPEEDFNSKEAQLLVSILTVLSNQLKPSTPQFVQMLTWTLKICQETSFEDPAFSKGILSLLFNLHVLHQSPVSLLLELCQDIHSQLGDIDQDVEVEKQSHFAIVNTKTTTTAIILVLSRVDRVLEEVEWLIAARKTHTASSKPASEASLTAAQQDPTEKAVTVQLGKLLTALHELVQTALPSGTCTATLLKELSRTYTILTTLGKYYVQVCSSQQEVLPARFERLVKLSGSHLTPQVYSFITYVQNGEAGGAGAAGETGGDDKKKKKRRIQANVAASAKLLRDTKGIPELIYSIEQYEKILISLSKKSKVNLMQYMRISTSRDFRINVATLDAALQEQDHEEQPDEDSDGTQETQEPKLKKRRS